MPLTWRELLGRARLAGAAIPEISADVVAWKTIFTGAGAVAAGALGSLVSEVAVYGAWNIGVLLGSAASAAASCF